MTYMLLLNCALNLVEEIILYCDARSKNIKFSAVFLLLNKMQIPKSKSRTFRNMVWHRHSAVIDLLSEKSPVQISDPVYMHVSVLHEHRMLKYYILHF